MKKDFKTEFSSNKLFLHPDRLEGLLNNDLTQPPISIEVSLTSECNINCKWCSDRDWREYSAGTIETEGLLRSLVDFKEMGALGVTIEGGGEPTLHPDFRNIVFQIKNLGLAVGLITNGVSFKDFDLVKHFEWIRVSLDASTPEEYLKSKGASKFTQVLDNIEHMCKVKEGCTIGVGYLISALSNTDVPGIAIRLKKMGVNYLQIRRLDDSSEIDVPLNYDVSDIVSLETDSFRVFAHQIYEEDSDEGNYGLPCVAHALSSVIGHNGDVYLCCRLHSHIMPSGNVMGVIGNIYEESIPNIWNGLIRKQMAKNMLDGAMCKRWCPSCRHSKNNVLVNELKNINTPNFI